MTRVTINPGVCGFITTVEAASEDGMEVKVKAESGCESVIKMFRELGDTFDSYEVCLVNPGKGPLYEFASGKFPAHCACPILSGITKAIEAECKLALPRNVSITFD